MIAGSSNTVGFPMTLKSLICSTLNLTILSSASEGAISLTPYLRPSEPCDFTFSSVIDFSTGFTSVRIPSYLTYALVTSDIMLPRIFDELID